MWDQWLNDYLKRMHHTMIKRGGEDCIYKRIGSSDAQRTVATEKYPRYVLVKGDKYYCGDIGGLDIWGTFEDAMWFNFESWKNSTFRTENLLDP